MAGETSEVAGISSERAGISSEGAGVSPAAAGGGSKGREATPMSPEILCAAFQDDVKAAVEERRPINGLQRAFGEVARLFGLSERRVRACWHGEVRSVSAAEWHAVRLRHQAVLAEREERLARDLATVQQRIALLETGL